MDRRHGGGETEQEGASVGVREQWSETYPLSKFETLGGQSLLGITYSRSRWLRTIFGS